MRVTVQLLCMTCCERLSESDDEGGHEASKRLDERAKAAGWIRVERHPKHPADVCAECAAIISERWAEVLDAELAKMRRSIGRILECSQSDDVFFAHEQIAALARAALAPGPADATNEGSKGR